MWLVFSYIWLPFMIVPVYGALERIPDSLLEASGDLGARNWRTLRSVVLPLALPGIVAGSIFTFSLTLGDFITPLLMGGANSQLDRQRDLLEPRHRQQPSVRGGAGDRADRDHGRLPDRRTRARSIRGAVMEGRLARIGLRVWVGARAGVPVRADRHHLLYAFNTSNVEGWPIRGLIRPSGSRSPGTTHRSGPRWSCRSRRRLFATVLALLLGSAAAFGVHRFRFFGREAVSLLLVLPLALPGIITGIALNSAFSASASACRC